MLNQLLCGWLLLVAKYLWGYAECLPMCQQTFAHALRTCMILEISPMRVQWIPWEQRPRSRPYLTLHRRLPTRVRYVSQLRTTTMSPHESCERHHRMFQYPRHSLRLQISKTHLLPSSRRQYRPESLALRLPTCIARSARAATARYSKRFLGTSP